MTLLGLHILADDSDLAIKALVVVAGLIFWGISSIAKLAKQSSEKEKLRMRQVREAITQSQQQLTLPMRTPPRLAPEIARRVPPVFATRAPAKRQFKRKVKDYNPTPQAARRAAPAPPPLPVPQKKSSPNPQDSVPHLVEEVASPLPSRKAATVNALAINRWLKPITLKQQFILTELFQPPLSLREMRYTL
jgi:hypothetical protein